MRSNFIALLCLSIGCIGSFLTESIAQSVTSPYQTALGGGLAITSGLEAHFYNPANLVLRRDRRSFQVSVAMGGFQQTSGLNTSGYHDLFGSFAPYFAPKNPASRKTLSSEEFDRMFSDNNRYFETRSYDFVPIAASWTNGSTARAVALRSRGLSSYEMNRNWFDSQSAQPDEDNPFSRTLNQNYHVFHEVSLGFAREVTMLNRWQAGLNTLLIGFSPKIVLGGMIKRVKYRSEYLSVPGGWQNTEHMEILATGDMSRFLTELISSENADHAFRNHVNRNSNFEINGIGAGLDAGLTYIIPIGDDISLSPHIREPLKKSIRISISLTDLGAVRYYNNPGDWQSRTIMRPFSDIPQSDLAYTGRPGEIFQYLKEDADESNVMANLSLENDAPLLIQLPTELNMGSALQYRWITTAIDLNYRFNTADFADDGWRASFGTQINIFRFLTLLGSLQLHDRENVFWGAGAVIDAGFASISAGMKLSRNDPESETDWEINSLSVASLKIKL